MNPLAFLSPYKWLLYGAFAIALIGGGTILVHRYNDGLREEGRAEVRAADKAAAEAQAASNRELSRLAELHLSAIATKQETFFTKASKEIHDESAPLVACVVPEPVRVRLNAAASCARGESATACDGADAVPDAR